MMVEQMAHGAGRGLLTIIRWPKGLDRNERARFLALASGIDEATLRLRIGQTPPSIVGTIDRNLALKAAKAVRQAGGDAFAPTLAEIEALGETRKIKRLLPSGIGFRAEMWNGETIHIEGALIDVIVRGRVEEQRREPDIHPIIPPVDPVDWNL